ncbi:hypothetical protein RUM44_010889 [Polyplax serrata]|uniref:Uncharacterized protein n=1 Tax=Polyplax serrata TaxID=468196 RepID=A0ABR1ANK5_POLSC
MVFNLLLLIISELSRNGNYAEGGVIKDDSEIINNASIKKFANITNKYSSHGVNESVSTFKKHVDENKFPVFQEKIMENQKIKPSLATKLNEIGSNLYLGGPEVIHINGTSSIKPRKGVVYTKIVPRKGAVTESEESASADSPDLCNSSWLAENQCHNVINGDDNNCFCCKTDKIQQPSINCTDCPQVNNCQYICCANESHLDKTFKKTIAHQSNEKYEIVSNKVKPMIETLQNSIKDSKSNSSSSTTNKSRTDIYIPHKNLKPEITKVPYDVEAVNEVLSNSKNGIFVPIAASIFLVPLFIMVIFFTWRNLKDYWEKRYYKRMDFLIDGMYND